MLPEDLIRRYPTIYHMAEADSWPSIRRHGLLSANEVMRRADLAGSQRRILSSEHRPEKVALCVAGIGTVVLRDQKPMSERRLRPALLDGMTPQQWYKLVNSRVFFWVKEQRLHGLLTAAEYVDSEHDVLTVDTASLLSVHVKRVRLCHMNSGNTLPFPQARGRHTFKTITDYPATSTGKPLKEVVELTVEGDIDDIARHVVQVRRMKGTSVIARLPLH
jgi:hypothetical protein